MRSKYVLFDILTLGIAILFAMGLFSESAVPLFLGKSASLWAAIIILGCLGSTLILLRLWFDGAVAVIAPVLNQAAIVGAISVLLWEVFGFTGAKYLPIRILLNTPDWVKALLPESAFERADFRTGRTDEITDDPLFGFRYAPGLSVVNRRGNASYRVVTDANGFPNVDESLYAGADVVVAGDSITMGSGVEFEEAWPQQLAGLSGLRVLSLGHGTWDVYQYPLALERYARKASPSVVIVTLWNWNDMQPRFYEYEDYKALHPEVRGFRDYSLKISSSVQLSAEAGGRANHLERALEALGTMLSFAAPFTVATASFMRSQIVPAPMCEFVLGGQKLQFQFRPYSWEIRNSMDGQQYLDRIARDFGRMRKISDEMGARELYLIYVPALEEVYIPLLERATDLNGCAKKTLAAYASGAYDLSRYLAYYEAAARTEGLVIRNITPFLQDWAAKGEKLTWTDDSHPNVLGHRRIAEYVRGILGESDDQLRGRVQSAMRAAPASAR